MRIQLNFLTSENLLRMKKTKKRIQKQQKRQKQTKNIKATSHAGQVSKINIKPLHYLMLALILVATLIAYFPTFDNGFTNWDDNGYVLENNEVKELSTENIKELFTRYDMGNYHPLTMLTLAIDYSLSEKVPPEKFGEEKKPTAFMFHFTNLLLHLANTALVFFVVFLMLKKYIGNKKTKTAKQQLMPVFVGLLSAALFGLNTIHVESVAWISERKDVLYSLFYLLSLLAYIKYTDERKTAMLIASLVFFVLSNLSKGQAVSLAVTLVAVDFLLGRNLKDKKVILEKVPYFVIALVFGVVAIFAQKQGEAIHEISEYPFYLRIVFASYSYIQYLYKMLVPINLSAIYPYPHPADGGVPAYYYVFVPLVGLVIWALIRSIKKNAVVAFSILFFSINIFLLLQLLPVGSAIMADRYAYIPSIGFFIFLAYGAYWLYSKFDGIKYPLYAGLAVYLIFIGVRTNAQTKIWSDSVTLWEHSLEVSPRGVVGWNNLGSAYDKMAAKFKDTNPEQEQHYKQIAVEKFTEAVNLKPDYTHAFYNRGTALKDMNRYEEALKDFNKALSLDQEFMEAYHNRGIARENSGDLQGAIADYNKAISLKPEQANLYANRGVAKGKLGRFDEAIEDFNISIKLKPENPEAYSNRGFAKVNQTKFEEGIADYNIALNINPNAQEPLYNRAIAYQTLGDTVTALRDYKQLLQIAPNHTDGLRNYAYIHFVRQQYKEAIEIYDRLVALNPQAADIINTRANAKFNLKDWQGAINDYSKVIQLQPQYSRAYYNRGMAYINQNNNANACPDFQKALSLGFANAQVAINTYCR